MILLLLSLLDVQLQLYKAEVIYLRSLLEEKDRERELGRNKLVVIKNKSESFLGKIIR